MSRSRHGGAAPSVVDGVRRAVPLPKPIRTRLQELAVPRAAWTWRRRRQLQGEYERRREYYQRAAEECGLLYREADVSTAARARLRERGYTPTCRALGDIHTFACFPSYGWHKDLLPDLRDLGPVTHFDYAALGFDVERIALADREGVRQRSEMLSRILPTLRRAQVERPVDWVFCYGGGQDTSPAVVRSIAEEFGIPIVNMSLDDKQGWAGRWTDECRTGAVDITAAFDLFITSARVACDWHLVEGGRPIYMPEGFDASVYRPRDVPAEIPVSFLGGAYGFRRSVIEFLRAHGVSIQTFGPGWPDGKWTSDAADIFNRSRINLGMGGIEYSESLTNVKVRDFEIPGTGGGAYLTSFNPDLAQHFIVGEEILCYRNRDEMLELIRYYLARPEEAREVARRARVRCLREHRWLHRYQRVLRILGVLEDQPAILDTDVQAGAGHRTAAV